MLPLRVGHVIVGFARRLAAHCFAAPIQERIYGYGLVPNHAPGPQLAVTQAEHLKKWETPIKASGFKAE